MNDYALHDLKLVYTVLHRNLMDRIELLDSDFFADLQRHLQKAASAQGVDVSHHAQWDAWLGQQQPSFALQLDGQQHVLN